MGWEPLDEKHTKWVHKCSLEWLKERQGYLTASEIASLLPVTKTGRKRTVDDIDRLRVLARKMRVLTDEDCFSYGAAARGHIMEPYAIDNLNLYLELHGSSSEHFHWWDDEVISLPDRAIAFSPDAMDVPQGDAHGLENLHAIAEVKSYSPEKHIVTAYTPINELEERWQIATAMALLEQIDHAYLVLFNPSMNGRKTFVIKITRSMLVDEIETIKQIEKEWVDFLLLGPHRSVSPNYGYWTNFGPTEQDIIEEYQRTKRLNP